MCHKNVLRRDFRIIFYMRTFFARLWLLVCQAKPNSENVRSFSSSMSKEFTSTPSLMPPTPMITIMNPRQDYGLRTTNGESGAWIALHRRRSRWQHILYSNCSLPWSPTPLLQVCFCCESYVCHQLTKNRIFAKTQQSSHRPRAGIVGFCTRSGDCALF